MYRRVGGLWGVCIDGLGGCINGLGGGKCGVCIDGLGGQCGLVGCGLSPSIATTASRAVVEIVLASTGPRLHDVRVYIMVVILYAIVRKSTGDTATKNYSRFVTVQ